MRDMRNGKRTNTEPLFTLILMKRLSIVSLVALLLSAIIAGCGDSSAQGPDNPAQAQAIQQHLTENFGASITTSWYPHIGAVSVKGNTVIVQTDLSSAAEAARGVCAGTSSFVFSNENSSAGLENVQVVGANGEVLINRRGIGDSCS